MTNAVTADRLFPPLARGTQVIGVGLAVLIVLFYLVMFPLEYRHPIDWIDVLREATNFFGVLAVSIWSRRDIQIINVGFVSVLISLWMEVVDEFTAEPLWMGTWVPALLGMGGLVLLAIGVREAYRRRHRELEEKLRAEAELERSHATLRAVVDGSPDAIWMKDLGGAYVLANAACARQLDKAPAVLIGRRDAELLPAEVAERHEGTDREAMQGHAVRYEESQPSDGSRRTFLVSKGLVRDEGGEAIGILGIARDISDRKVVEERLAHQATHDALTGLPNRAAFLDRLGRELSRTLHQPRHNLAVLFLDVDGFKAVNDRFGHAAGDDVLVAMAGLLTQWVRPGDYVARFGGDEFTVLLQEVEGVADAVHVVERIQQGLRAPLTTADGAVTLSVSVGVALSATTGPAAEDLLRAADEAMYRAKTAGGGRHAVHVAPVPHGRAGA